jgi:hypothetical protein
MKRQRKGRRQQTKGEYDDDHFHSCWCELNKIEKRIPTPHTLVCGGHGGHGQFGVLSSSLVSVVTVVVLDPFLKNIFTVLGGILGIWGDLKPEITP